MPDGDELSTQASQMNITGEQNGRDYLTSSAPTTATTRLLHEVNEMKSQTPLAFPSRTVRDVTENFIAASKQLRPGELVKDEYFTLFEAVGALEIMDPKMDSGYVAPGDTFAADFDVCSSLAAHAIIGIMDELLRLEMLFHNGYPLSQTIFTSLHVDRLIAPDNHEYAFCDNKITGHVSSSKQGKGLVHVVLQAYCLGVVKSVELALHTVQHQTYYEEEDFTTALFGRELCPKLTVDQAMNSLVKAMDWTDSSKLEKQLKYAIKHRLVIREQLLYAMDEPVHGGSYNWARLKRQIQKLQEKDLRLGASTPVAFSEKVQRKLATSAPPREVPELTLDDALKQWIQMCDDILAVRNLMTEDTRSNSFCLQRATWIFGYRYPKPNTFVRAKTQDIVFSGAPGAGVDGLAELLYDDMRQLVLAGHPAADVEIFNVEMTADPRFRLARLLEDFINKAIPLYQDMFRMLCQNTSRKRRMCSDALRQWYQLEKGSQQADKEFFQVSKALCNDLRNTTPFMQWAELYRLKHSIWLVQFGFETDLYLPGEMEVMFRSLDYLSNTLYMHLGSLRARNQRIFGDHPSDQADLSRNMLDWLLAETGVTIKLTQCMCMLYTFLGVTKIIRDGVDTYTQSQYEARMKPFLELQFGARERLIPPLEHVKVGLGEMAHPSHGTAVGFAKEHTRLRKEFLSGSLKKLEEKDHGIAVPTWGPSEKGFSMKALQTMLVAMGVEVGRLAQVCSDHGNETVSKPYLADIVEADFKRAEDQYHLWWHIPHFVVKG